MYSARHDYLKEAFGAEVDAIREMEMDDKADADREEVRKDISRLESYGMYREADRLRQEWEI